MASVSYEQVHKAFKDVEVIRNLDLEIGDGEFVAYVGPSGCGKTTLLRLLSGLESVSAGRIRIGGRNVTDLSPKERNVSMVFQNYALYPHMTVAQNIGFGLRVRHVPAADRSATVRQAAEMLGIDHLLERKPRQLSGGQRQRVAMGRAIVRDPDVFLMDEPLSNLDAQLRNQMRSEIRALQRRLGATMIYVTHDQVEAMSMADRIVVLEGGEIQQIGGPDDLFRRPANRFVAGFIGAPAMNLIPIEREGGDARLGIGPALPDGVPGPAVEIGIRPQDLRITNAATVSDGHGIAWDARVDLVEPLGGETLVHLPLGDNAIRLRHEGPAREAPGESVRVGFQLADAHFFDRTGQAIR